MKKPRHCWLRLKRHVPYKTGMFDFRSGWVWRCERCQREVTSLPSQRQSSA